MHLKRRTSSQFLYLLMINNTYFDCKTVRDFLCIIVHFVQIVRFDGSFKVIFSKNMQAFFLKIIVSRTFIIICINIIIACNLIYNKFVVHDLILPHHLEYKLYLFLCNMKLVHDKISYLLFIQSCTN